MALFLGCHELKPSVLGFRVREERPGDGYSQHTVRGPVSVASPVAKARGWQLPPFGVPVTRPDPGAKGRLHAEPWVPLPICSGLPAQVEPM